MQVDYAEEEKEYFHPVTDMPISKENYDKAVQEGSDLPLPYEDYELDTWKFVLLSAVFSDGW